jgi:predicted ribosomally synthesized peptide with nif11-like leader
MSLAAANAFLERAETDKEFAAEFEDVKDSRTAVLDKVRASGYDVTPDEVLEAFTERYGAELTPEQLDKIAAGADDAGVIAGAVVGGVIGAAAVVAVCAAFAA